MKRVLVYLILSSLAIILLTADDKEWCVDTRHNITDCHELHLFCKEGYVISEIELFAGNEDCNLRSRCKGLSPITQSDVMSCYWKQNCSVKIPAQRMVFFHNTRSSTPFKQKVSCFVTPKSFHVTRLSCTNIKTSDVRNICPQNGKSIVSVERKGPSMGIIRSHDLWPWNYPENQKNCSLTFAYPLSRFGSYSTRLTIAHLDINANHHLFVTKGKRKEVKKTGNIRIRRIKSNVKIAFVANSQNPTSSRKGFVICYRHEMKRRRGKGKKKGRTQKTRNKKTKNKKKGRQSRAKRKARKRKNVCKSVMEPMDLNDDTIRLQGNSTGYGCQSTEDEYH